MAKSAQLAVKAPASRPVDLVPAGAGKDGRYRLGKFQAWLDAHQGGRWYAPDLAAYRDHLLAEVDPDFDADLLNLWAVTALAIAAVTWLILLGQTRRLLWAIERWTGADLDGDGTTGQPPPAPAQERVVIVNAGLAQQEAAQRATSERASQFADFVARLPVKGTAMAAWESELGRETYQEYRDALIRLGWARWNSEGPNGPNLSQGWKLALPAEAILARISA